MIDAEDTGMELLCSGVGVAQAHSCTVRVFMGTRDKPSKSSQVYHLEANFLQPSCFFGLSGCQSRWVRAGSGHVPLGAHPARVPLDQCSQR